MLKLKPCPFCGSEAIIRTCFENTFFRVECNHIMLRCGAMFEWFETEEDAISAWNKRVKEDEE